MKLGRLIDTTYYRLRDVMIEMENELRISKLYFKPMSMRRNLNAYRITFRAHQL